MSDDDYQIDTSVFKESTIYSLDDSFIVHDFYGNEHKMNIRENLSDMYYRYANFDPFIIDKWKDVDELFEILPYDESFVIEHNSPCLRVASGDDNDVFSCFECIFLPEEFSGKVFLNFDGTIDFDCPRVLSSLSCDMFSDTYNKNEYAEELTPLQEMMFQDIIEIVENYDGFDDTANEWGKKCRELWGNAESILDKIRYSNYLDNTITEYLERVMSEAIKGIIPNEEEYTYYINAAVERDGYGPLITGINISCA